MKHEYPISFLILMLVLAAVECFAQPYEPHIIWDRSGQADSSSYGTQILPLGDQNDDGYSDWAVMAWGNIGYSGTQSAYLEFFHGGDSLSQDPYLLYHGEPDVYSPSWSVLGVGDLNGDGYQDWLLWAWPLSHPANYLLPIYFGGPQADTLADAHVPTTSHSAVYNVGDFNGNGFSDIYTFDENTLIGRMYFGGSLMDTTADWIINQPPPGINQSIPYVHGDFNGDGNTDFLCYNPNPPFNAAVFLGGATPDTVPDYFWSNMTQPLGGVESLNGDPYDELLFSAVNGASIHFGGLELHSEPSTFVNSDAAGYAVSAGDFNHDSFNDLILFTPTTASNMFGVLDLHLGHPWLNPTPAFEIRGSWPDGLIGIYSAAGLGDVNGDGFDDIAIGAWDDFAYLGWRGRCIIIAGDDSLIADADNPRPEVPRALGVEAYPNPFNSETTIKLQIPFSERLTTVTIYNVLGELVQREVLPLFGNSFAYHFNAVDLPSGVYLAHVQSGDLQATQKLMLLK